MKYRCNECQKLHENKPIICACGSFVFLEINIFKLSHDRDVYEDGGSDED